MVPTTAAAPPAATEAGGEDGSNLILRTKLTPGRTPAQNFADLTVDGVTGNAAATFEWAEWMRGQLDLSELFVSVGVMTEVVKRGDLGALEAMLTAQAVTLNTVFVTMMRRAHATTLINQLETYARLGLTAQRQCRATAETLAVIKNPPVFAKQANIANGPQQVNNAPVIAPVMVSGSRAPAREIMAAPNKLLEEAPINGERLDGGAAGTAGAGHTTLATVGAVNRPADE